jgi:hypothetical protein
MEAPTLDLPDAYLLADRHSLRGQERTLRGTQVRLGLTMVATVALALSSLLVGRIGGLDDVESLGLLAAVLFLAALLYELRLLRTQPERDWYDGRAVAESVKTLAWRYSVGGLPYPVSEHVDQRVQDDVHRLGTDVPVLRVAVESAPAITPSMQALRATPIETRRHVYLNHRIRDQEQWYAAKARYNRSRARFWSIALIVLEALGVVLATLKALAVVHVDLASVASAGIGCGAAWLAVKQHETVGTAYGLAARELAAIASRLGGILDEETWAQEVADAEEAISREHTMWRASRTTQARERSS